MRPGPNATNEKPRAHLVLFHAQRLASNHNAARAQHLQTRDVSAPATLPRATKKGRTNCLHKNNRAKRKAHPRGYNFFLAAGRVCTSYCTDRRVYTSYCTSRRVCTSYCTDRRVCTSYCTDVRVFTSHCTDRGVCTSYWTDRRVCTSYCTDRRLARVTALTGALHELLHWRACLHQLLH